MKRSISILICIAMLLSFSSCKSTSDAKPTIAPSSGQNPNRLPPGPYTQSASYVPSKIDDPFYSVAAPWSPSGYFYLWSYQDLNIFQTYTGLTLPQTEITVAIIDTGVDKDHEDLAGRLWINPGESGTKSTNGTDDDADGFVDDFMGWDFVNHTNNPADDAGHGTHIAGTIAATGENAKGIIGIAPWVRIMPVKVCDSAGTCDSSDIRAGIAYAVNHGAKIINISLGGPDLDAAESAAFEQIITDATNAGTLVFTAAGNEADNANNYSPTNTTNAITVAAHRNDDKICSFSNFGWKVDVSGPGCALKGNNEVSGILSLNSKKCGSSATEYCPVSAPQNTVANGYVLRSGTSMSTPHAVGMAAVAWTASPDASPYQIRQALLRTAGMAASKSKNQDFGAGRLSGTNLIDEARNAPGVKIRAPRYGTSASTFDITLRIEARNYPVHWGLKYIALNNNATIDLSTGVGFGPGGDVSSKTSSNFAQAWTPPSSGKYLVILDAVANNQHYYDTLYVSKP